MKRESWILLTLGRLAYPDLDDGIFLPIFYIIIFQMFSTDDIAQNRSNIDLQSQDMRIFPCQLVSVSYPKVCQQKLDKSQIKKKNSTYRHNFRPLCCVQISCINWIIHPVCIFCFVLFTKVYLSCVPDFYTLFWIRTSLTTLDQLLQP